MLVAFNPAMTYLLPFFDPVPWPNGDPEPL